MTRINLRFITIALVSLVLSTRVLGQTSKGFVVGNVVDPNGAIVVGATVKLANAGTGVTREAVTSEDGSFRFDAIDPGTYRIEVSRTGFKTATRDHVIVTAAQTIETQFRLDVGTQTEVVIVTSGNERERLIRSQQQLRNSRLSRSGPLQAPLSNEADASRSRIKRRAREYFGSLGGIDSSGAQAG